MFYEIRQYGARPGRRDDLVRVMERDVIPFQRSKGMDIVGSFVSLDDETGFVWIRRFESEAEKERLYAAVYEDSHWKESIAPKIGDALDRETIRVTRVEPTTTSSMR